MKRLTQLLIAIFIYFGLYSCKSNDDISLGGDSPKNRMSIHVLNQEIAANEPYIRMVVDYDGWVMFDITSAGMNNRDGHPFMILHKLSQTGYYIYGTPKSYLIYKFSDTKELSEPQKVLVVNDMGDSFRYSVVSGITNTTYNIEQEVVKAKSERAKQRSKMQMVSHDYFDDYNVSIFNTISNSFDELSDDIDQLGTIAGILGGTGGELIATFWTNIAIPLAKYQILAFNPELQNQLVEKIGEETVGTAGGMVGSVLNSFIMSLIPSEYHLIYTITSLVLPSTIIGNMWKSRGEINLNQDNPADNNYGPLFTPSWIADKYMYNRVKEIEEEPVKYELTVFIGNVTETTAEVSGSIDFWTGNYISSMGFMYEDCLTGRISQEPITPAESPEYILTGLTPCTTYYVYFYFNEMGRTYCSPGYPFTTKGDMQLRPANITFPSAGGTENVKLSLNSEYMTSWSITSAPSWCQVVRSNEQFFVTVGEYKKSNDRSGTITVTANLTTGETKTASVAVTQKAYEKPSENWDHTAWRFSEGTKYDFNISIESVAQKSFTCSGFITNYWTFEEFSQLRNGSIEMWGYYTGGSDGVIMSNEAQITLTRTSETTATATMQYSVNEVPLFWGTEIHDKGTITLNGILINE